MDTYTSAATAKLASHLALGGAGIGGFLVHLFIWHEIWRLVFYVWHIPTFGPFIFFSIIAAFIGYRFWRQQRGPGRRRGGSAGYGTGSGPRDW